MIPFESRSLLLHRSSEARAPRKSFYLHSERQSIRRIPILINNDMGSVNKKDAGRNIPSVWARPEMEVTFIAELMPGLSREDRTFRIETVLRNGRVKLHDFPGEFREAAFEPLDFNNDKS